MFGTGKSQVGMIIVASELAKSMDPEALIDAITPAVEEQNTALPA